MTTSGPTLVTHAAGVTPPSSISVPQQALPISHYPPNYFPYGHYFSPYYVPPPSIHQFFSNGAFPQQPQYKDGNNTAHVGVASSYGPYGSTPDGYNPSSASTAGSTPSNDDLSTSQLTGQRSEGSTSWIHAPGRDISGLQTSSFYNIPHGQVTPTQTGHGAFSGIYHPVQAVSAETVHHPLLQQSQATPSAADLMGPPATSVYQQPQSAQLNWPNTY